MEEIRLLAALSNKEITFSLSLGINFKSLPCLRKIFPAVWLGLIPIPLLVIIALVSGVTLNCSAMNLIAALNGASSGTSILYLIIFFIFIFLHFKWKFWIWC